MASAETKAILEAAGPQAAEAIVAVETRLREVSSNHPAPLGPYVAEAVAAGGKRLRPLLAVLSAGAAAPDLSSVVRSGVAVELIHAATLVHDDILDSADVRRGVPTVVAAGGREMAVAAGDLLFAVAFGELIDNGVESVAVLAAAGSDLARGELLQRADAWKTDISEDRYLTRCHLKTARLFEAAATLGAMAGGLDPRPFQRFARSVGLAFQLLDDVLDVTGPPERTGKPRGADLLDGTVTLPWIVAAARDSTLTEVDLHDLDSGSAVEICDRIEATGALDDVRSQAAELAAEAQAIAVQMASPTAEALSLVATTMVERSS